MVPLSLREARYAAQGLEYELEGGEVITDVSIPLLEIMLLGREHSPGDVISDVLVQSYARPVEECVPLPFLLEPPYIVPLQVLSVILSWTSGICGRVVGYRGGVYNGNERPCNLRWIRGGYIPCS